MSAMFADSISFNHDLSKWDVSSVTDMSLMFGGTMSFNQDLSKWDVSAVTDMSGMFYGASGFNRDLSKWDVSAVTNMQKMFQDADFFNQDVSKWDVSAVTDMSGMFQNANNFDQMLCGPAWVHSRAVKTGMFEYSEGSIGSPSDCGGKRTHIVNTETIVIGIILLLGILVMISLACSMKKRSDETAVRNEEMPLSTSASDDSNLY